MTDLYTFLILIVFSFLAFWKPNAILFMILFALSMMLGLASPDMVSSETTTTGTDMAVALALIIYGLLCAGWSFRLLFWREE